jgi:ATP-binding protein involved in chromosome partitioning
MGFLVDENKSSLNWRGLILNRAVRHFLEDVEWGDLDYLVIDMPPGTGDVQMGLAKMLPRSDMIVVTTPSKTVQTVASRVASMAQSYYLRIAGVIENMTSFINEDGKKYEIFGSGGGAQLAEELGVPLLGSIPIDPIVSQSSDNGSPIVLEDGHASEALNAIVDEIIHSAIPRINPVDCTAHNTLETPVSIKND